jgi:hypothetical protein
MTDSLAVTTSAPKLILKVSVRSEFNTGDEKTPRFAPTHSCGRWAMELRPSTPSRMALPLSVAVSLSSLKTYLIIALLKARNEHKYAPRKRLVLPHAAFRTIRKTSNYKVIMGHS